MGVKKAAVERNQKEVGVGLITLLLKDPVEMKVKGCLMLRRRI